MSLNRNGRNAQKGVRGANVVVSQCKTFDYARIALDVTAYVLERAYRVSSRNVGCNVNEKQKRQKRQARNRRVDENGPECEKRELMERVPKQRNRNHRRGARRKIPANTIRQTLCHHKQDKRGKQPCKRFCKAYKIIRCVCQKRQKVHSFLLSCAFRVHTSIRIYAVCAYAISFCIVSIYTLIVKLKTIFCDRARFLPQF